MNNGKVRIYELSKELNLENKDILAVCDSLNISVKSHSSTITESDAERIRKTAENLPHSQGKSAQIDGGNFPPKDSGANGGERKKQEILEIRKPKAPDDRANNKLQGEQRENDRDLVANPPKSPVSIKQIKPPVKPLLNSPPDRDGDGEEVNTSGVETQENQNIPTSKTDTFSEEEEKPKLVGPPPRPASPAPKQPISQPTLSDRSGQKKKLEGKRKRDKDKERDKEDASLPKHERQGIPDKAKGAEKPIVGETSDAPKGLEMPRKVKPAVKAKAVPELHRPQPARKVALKGDSEPELEEEENKEAQDTDSPDTELDLEKPRRKVITAGKVTLARASKRGAKWEEEEEEESDVRLKAAKAAAKSKRLRPKPMDDDDVDIEDDDESLEMPAPAAVSLSLARPPKPKNSTPKNKPAPSMPKAASGPDKSKKTSSSRDSSGDNNRGLSESSERQRPETFILREPMTVQELAATLLTPETDIIKRLFMKGIAVNITETLDLPTIKSVAEDLGIVVETASQESAAKKTTEMLEEGDLENLQRRPPVVTIMGHVDHGKTTLLDSIRSTKVAQGEAGGITQHIGAYHVDVEHNGVNQQVVFLDTPGHEAFTAMRARGAKVTDVAILVVAADDGVQPQTKEAISHAKAAGVPLVVAINKIDKEGANPDRVKQELMEHGLVPEEWGGDTIMVPVSAIKGENLDNLLEMILLVSEIEDLQANPNRRAKGTTIEAHLDKAKGPVATLLVQNGTLKLGDIVVAGSAYGKVKAMIDDRGNRVDEAGPSFAVEVLGLRDVPKAGDEFDVFEEEKEASAIAGERVQQARASRLLQGRYSLSALSARALEGELKELNLILKSDVQGSLEAILGSLRQLPQKEVQLRLLLAAPGEITETDIDLAAASGAVIIGFNTTMATGSRQAADLAGVDVREYNIIYKLLDDIQGAMEGLLEPELVEEPLGEAQVRAVFSISRGAVAGCYVLSGKMIRNCNARIRRNGEVVHEGILDSLKRMKDDAKEVNAGYECGIALSSFSTWAEGDIIEAYRMATKRRKLST